MSRERPATLQLPAGDWRRGSSEFREPKLTENLAIVDRLRTLGARHGRSPAEVAIAWTLHRSEVTGAVVGARNASQIDGGVVAADFRLTPSEIAEIER